MQNKSRKIIIFAIIVLMMIAYYFYAIGNLSPTSSSQSSIDETTKPQVEVVIKKVNKAQLSQTEKSLTSNSTTEYFIDSIPWADVYDIKIDALSGFSFVLNYLILPEDIKQYLRDGDWVSAVTLLEAEPANPDFVIALDMLHGQCKSAVEYEPKSTDEDKPNDKQALSSKAQEFFIGYQQRVEANRLLLRDVCTDLLTNFDLDIEKRKQALANNKDSILSQLIIDSENLGKEQILDSLRKLYEKEQSHRAQQSLFHLLIDTEKEEHLQEAITLFQSLNKVTPYEYLSLARCLEDRCQGFANSLAPREHWLTLAAQKGEYSALLLHQEAKDQWSDIVAWTDYKMALLKSGCSDTFSFNGLKQQFQLLRNKHENAKEKLLPQQVHEAKILAGELYREYSAQAKSWLGCN